MPNILFLDIETAPKLAHVWQFWKTNIGLNQLKTFGHIMSFAAIWNEDGDKNALYFETRTENDERLVRQLIRLLDDADIVVGHNVDQFDLGTIKARALALGIKPPSPYKIVDTLKIAKKQFRFDANSLAYLCEVLPIKHKKLKHNKFPGFELWKECMAGNDEAWKEMKKYNVWDTLSVRDVYYLMRPWIANHPNVANAEESEELLCPKCGSSHVHCRGYAYTNVGKYRKFQCQDCGGWSRTRITERFKELARSLLTNA